MAVILVILDIDQMVSGAPTAPGARRHYQHLAHTVKVMTTIMRYKTRGGNEKPLQLDRAARKVKSTWTISKTVDRRPES